MSIIIFTILWLILTVATFLTVATLYISWKRYKMDRCKETFLTFIGIIYITVLSSIIISSSIWFSPISF